MAEVTRPHSALAGGGGARRRPSANTPTPGRVLRDPRTTEIEPGERLVLFTTTARLSEDGGHWLVPIHGRIFQPDHGRASKAALSLALKGFGVRPDEFNRALFDERCALLLGENSVGRQIVITVAGIDHVLPASGRDGQFRGEALVPATAAALAGGNGRVIMTARLPVHDDRRIEGRAILTGPRGISVISDIDDTVKITHVGDRRRMMALTFLQPFEAVAGMAARYCGWADAGAAVHFISSSPWPLYEPLAAFLSEAGFPDATTTLKNVSLRDRSIRNFLANSTRTKPPAIDALFAAFPARRFVLIGDDVENDARIYADVVHRHPGRVARIYIRHTEGHPRSAGRAYRALIGVQPGLWQIFGDAAELPERLA